MIAKHENETSNNVTQYAWGTVLEISNGEIEGWVDALNWKQIARKVDTTFHHDLYRLICKEKGIISKNRISSTFKTQHSNDTFL